MELETKASQESEGLPMQNEHAEGTNEHIEQSGSAPLPFFKRGWRLAKIFTGGVSNLALGMVWRGDKDFERALDSMSKYESVLKARLHKRGSSWRWFARSIMLWSVALEVIFLNYAIYMTHSAHLEWQRRALIVLPVFLLPACATLLYKVLANYYRMRERQDKQALDVVQQKMKQRLDEVKDKSNFYRTLEVIQRYDNDPVVKAAAATVLGSKLGLKTELPPELQAQFTPTGRANAPESSPAGLRKRRSSNTAPSGFQTSEVSTPGFTNRSQGRLSEDGSTPVGPGFRGSGPPMPANWQPTQHHSGGFVGTLERIAQMLVGEDPTQCYALICERCRQHNGLAKKEDTDVLMYHCRFCHHLNGTKDENIVRKCRCYFCSEIRRTQGLELEVEDNSKSIPGSPRELKGTTINGSGSQERAEPEKAEGNEQPGNKAARGGQKNSKESDRGAIDEGWEELRPRTE